MTKKEKALITAQRLEKRYPEAICSLTAEKPHELLIATRLSAQCTDARVNIVTKPLFEKYKSVNDFAGADVSDIENIIHSCGLYKTKARDIVKMCQQLRDNFGGEVPDSIEKLTSLSGVGRKTANLIMGDIFGEPAVVTDTHLIRISNRIGLVDVKDPYKVEIALKKILPPEKSSDFCHRIVHFGRDVCKAPTPKCDECELKDICIEYKIKS
ncbi:MAG: endonuclease III [Clostridia bacterium]|nr:endonuclease III [Clostridia bacterium]